MSAPGCDAAATSVIHDANKWLVEEFRTLLISIDEKLDHLVLQTQREAALGPCICARAPMGSVVQDPSSHWRQAPHGVPPAETGAATAGASQAVPGLCPKCLTSLPRDEEGAPFADGPLHEVKSRLAAGPTPVQQPVSGDHATGGFDEDVTHGGTPLPVLLSARVGSKATTARASLQSADDACQQASGGSGSDNSRKSNNSENSAFMRFSGHQPRARQSSHNSVASSSPSLQGAGGLRNSDPMANLRLEGLMPPRFPDHRKSQRTSIASDETTRTVGRSVLSNWIEAHHRSQTKVEAELWDFLEEPESSTAAYWFAGCMPTFILLSVFISLLQAFEPTLIEEVRALALEATIDAIFALEIIIRFVVCPNRWLFLLSLTNLIDVTAAAPLVPRLLAFTFASTQPKQGLVYVMMLGYVPVLRLLKMLRRCQKLHLLLRAFYAALEALPVLLFIYFILLLFFTALLYSVEPHSNVSSLPRAMWLTIISMTTVGYGEIYPTSGAGQIIVATVVVTSSLYMSIPYGILGNCFSEVWKDRDRILLVQRLRSRLWQWGYHAHDIPKLFEYFDTDNNGLLNINEFSQMVKLLRLGLPASRVLELFAMIGNREKTVITVEEFVRALFPGAHHELFDENGNERVRTTPHCTFSFSLRSAIQEDNESPPPSCLCFP